jgi:hypothetical protein
MTKFSRLEELRKLLDEKYRQAYVPGPDPRGDSESGMIMYKEEGKESICDDIIAIEEIQREKGWSGHSVSRFQMFDAR